MSLTAGMFMMGAIFWESTGAESKWRQTV